MREGMLWFDRESERSLSDRLEKAARHFEAKYGHQPTVCYVHPSMFLAGMEQVLEGLTLKLKPSNSVLPHHFWLGDEDPATRKTA